MTLISVTFDKEIYSAGYDCESLFLLETLEKFGTDPECSLIGEDQGREILIQLGMWFNI